MSDEQADTVAQQFGSGTMATFEQHIEIWMNKIDNPLLCEEDGPVHQLRRRYEQFYVDVEDVTEDMVTRFEFEIDTTRSGRNWDEETTSTRTVRWPSRRLGDPAAFGAAGSCGIRGLGGARRSEE
ncbi:hypothetical protein GCM10023094_31960 [Rhodococcus olei]|uniref:3-ketosteroid-9-alpha-monooxygenase oxygenase component-like C-terminal domain-containing protein n=1 Tax=Rhodococcus olei TaxID=2161675 RepID=A0ABP8P8N4_9NOCA